MFARRRKIHAPAVYFCGRKSYATMKHIFPLLFALLFIGCSDAAQRGRTDVPVTGKVNMKSPLRQDPADQGRDAPALTFRMGEAAAAKGQIACLPVEVSGFNDLLAFQYTVRFDSAALKFHSVRNLALDGYQANNFGTRFADRGFLSTLWTAKDVVKGNTLPTDHKLYEVCFENLMPKGQEAEVKFQNGPTAFEVIGPNLKRYRLVHANGKVVSK